MTTCLNTSSCMTSLNSSVTDSLQSHRPTPNILDDDDVAQIIKRKTGKSNLPVTNWRLDPVTSVGGFMGTYYHLTATIDRCTLKFFVKTPPPPGPQREFLSHADLFNKEIVMYEEIVTQMTPGCGPKWYAECYLCKRDVVIVLEDLAFLDYVTLDKYVPFGFDELLCLFNTFASFHSRSLILEEQLRRQDKSLHDVWGNALHEGLVTADEPSILFHQSSAVGTQALVDMVDELDSEAKSVVKRKILKWTKNLLKSLEPSKKYRNVLCHRDVWSANFMFKLDNQKKPQNCRLIDFQFYSYLYPAMDLMLTMYMSSCRKIRDEYYEGLIKFYYNRLREFSKDEGLIIDNIIPWNVLLESCEHARSSAMVYTINHQQITLLEADVCEKYFSKSPELLRHVLYSTGRHELVCAQFKKVPVYRERLSEVIIEMYERLPDQLPDDK